MINSFLKRSLRCAIAISALTMVPAVFAQTYVTATTAQTFVAGGQGWVTANCPTGYVVTGGGYSQTDTNQNSAGGDTEALGPNNQYVYFAVPYIYVWASQPTPSGTGWEVQGNASAIYGGILNVYARCVLPSS
jgi:hypothetical protein